MLLYKKSPHAMDLLEWLVQSLHPSNENSLLHSFKCWFWLCFGPSLQTFLGKGIYRYLCMSSLHLYSTFYLFSYHEATSMEFACPLSTSCIMGCWSNVTLAGRGHVPTVVFDTHSIVFFTKSFVHPPNLPLLPGFQKNQFVFNEEPCFPFPASHVSFYLTSYYAHFCRLVLCLGNTMILSSRCTFVDMHFVSSTFFV